MSDSQAALLLSIKAQIDSVNTEVEAMKAENAACLQTNNTVRFVFNDFNDKAIALYHLGMDARRIYG